MTSDAAAFKFCGYHRPNAKALGADAVGVGFDLQELRAIEAEAPAAQDPSAASDRLDTLVADARERGLRVIVDLVPNHCSSDHPLFQQALAAAPGSPERDLFIFRDGKGPAGDQPPATAFWSRPSMPLGSHPPQWPPRE